MSLTFSDYKKIAKNSLRGHWGTVLFSCFLCSVFGAFFFSIPFIITHCSLVVTAMVYFEPLPHYFILLVVVESLLLLLYFFIGSSMELGYIDLNLSMLDRRKASILKVVAHFGKMDKAIWFRILYAVMKLVGFLVFVIPGLYVTLAYSMTPYIIEEKKHFSLIQAMQASRMIMKGHKSELFFLRLSFLGWYLLGILTLGIGFFYTIPYIKCTEAVFFNEISGRADVYYGRISQETDEDREESELTESEE